MLLSEEQARKTVCPHLPVDYEISYNNQTQQRQVICFAKCLASECSQWQFGKDGWRKSDGTVISTDREPEKSLGGRWVVRGYCGLAHKEVLNR